MKKIGLLIDTLIGGGAERIVLNFAEALAKLGHEIHIILIKNIIEHEVDRSLYKIHYLTENDVLSKNKFLNKKNLTQKLKEKVKELESDSEKFGLFISNAEDMDLLAKNAKLENFYIIYRNSMYVYYESKFKNTTGFRRLRRKLKFKFQFKHQYNNQNIIIVSKALINDITKQMRVKPKTIQNIYNPFDFDKIRKRGNEINEQIPNEKYIIYAAKFENRKNQKLLVKTCKKADINFPLVVIGNTHTQSDKEYLFKLKQLIKELNQYRRKSYLSGFSKKSLSMDKKCGTICNAIK